MSSTNPHLVLPALPLALALGACSSLFGKPDSLDQVDDLLGQVERVQVASTASRERAHDALERLDRIVSSDFTGDASIAFEGFVKAIEQSEHQARELESALGPMKRAAVSVFRQWERDLDGYSNDTMRKLSKNRLASTRRRYDAIVDAAEPTLQAYKDFNLGLRDHALFLSHDFNTYSVAEIKEEVRQLENQERSLANHFDATETAARAYVKSAELRGQVDPAGADARKAASTTDPDSRSRSRQGG